MEQVLSPSVTIPALPPSLQVVPSTRDEWLHWRQGVLAWRSLVHEDCEDPETAALHYGLAAEDTAYYITMFCPIYEPRATPDWMWNEETGEWEGYLKPPGWYPWVPFPFQVEMVRWIERVKAISQFTDTTGKGDGIVEKSREMGASWMFCAVAAHDFLFGENQEIGFISYKEEVVDKKGSSKSLFYKLRALIGVFDKVPKLSFAPETIWHELPTRLPDFFVPAGFTPKRDDQTNQILHPTKNNALRGNSTSGKTGLGDRLSWVLIDEASKNEDLLTIWGGLSATTFHRFANSSADRRFGDDFMKLAQNAREAVDFGRNGPSFFPIPWNLHPLRDENWLISEKARSDLDPHQFAREYLMDYSAGFGDWVYPYGQQMYTKPAPYVPALGPLVVTVDPGVADPSAMILFQDDPGGQRVRLCESAMLKVTTAEELVPILMGFPVGHPEFDKCPEQARDFMLQMWEVRRNREPVRWVGDPYGKSAGGSGKETFYEAMERRSIELSLEYPDLPEVKIVVLYNFDNDARYHPGRKLALGNLLPSLDINDTAGGRQFLEALRTYRYEDEEKSNSERLKPIHGWGSHLVTAAEFAAVHSRADRDADRMRHKRTPGPHVPPSSRRSPQKPRLQRVA